MQKQDKSINQKLFIKTVSEKYTLKLFLFLLEFKKHRNIDIAFKNPRKIKITHCFISEIQQCKAGNHVSIMPFVFFSRYQYIYMNILKQDFKRNVRLSKLESALHYIHQYLSLFWGDAVKKTIHQTSCMKHIKTHFLTEGKLMDLKGTTDFYLRDSCLKFWNTLLCVLLFVELKDLFVLTLSSTTLGVFLSSMRTANLVQSLLSCTESKIHSR